MPAPTTVAPVDVIGPGAVRQALAALRHLESKARHDPNPLLRLRLVGAQLRRLGVAPTDENRRWALAGVLEEIVTEHLARLRGEAPAGRPGALPAGPMAIPSVEDELARAAADFRAGNRALECWSAIHSRFISPAAPPMDDVAHVASVGRVTLARRLNEGLVLLSDALRARELAQLGAGPSAPPAQRLRLLPDAHARTGPLERVASRVVDALRAEAHGGLELSLGDARALAARPPADLTAYRVARIAQWSAPRYALDRTFVALTLVVDAGEEEPGGRWQPRGGYDDLGAALAAAASPVAVLLGAPGCGKSTLLRRFELDLAVAGLRGEEDAVTFFVPLGEDRLDAGPPGRWLAARWRQRFPALPPLERFLRDGRLTLLLDGLNEIPHADAAAYHDRVAAWKRYLGGEVAAVPGNRVLVTCRSLDYSAPLSTPRLRVPQVQVEPMSDAQVRAMIASLRPALAARLWERLAASPLLAAVRVPYTLALLLEHVGPAGALPGGVAALFTDLVRRSLRREVDRDHPAVRPGPALDVRDLRQVAQWRWLGAHDLPERGRLFPGLSALAVGMQQGVGGDGAQVRLARGAALAAVGDAAPEAVLDAALAAGLLDEDLARDDISFRHQLLQEYFAARHLARRPDPERVRRPWRAADLVPSLAETLPTLAGGEPLPALPGTGWEETTGLAAEMSPDPAAFVSGVAGAHLALAGRCAARPGVRGRLDAAFVQDLAQALVARSRDPAGDLRARIAAARAAGDLGDPRLAPSRGPHGDHLLPPLVALPAGTYALGRSEPFEALGRTWWARYAPHRLALPAFSLGAYPVTNAEWACFMKGGGYDDDAWWDTPAAAAWRRGEGTTAGIHASVRAWLARYAAQPDLLESTWRDGSYSTEVYERWRRRMAMSPAQLEAHLAELYPSARQTAPRRWHDSRFNHPSQPVVAITWYEARAYCAWLAAQTGRPYRLPSDVELEAAARGPGGERDYPWGGPFDPLRLNGVTTHVMATSPIGVFPEGDTPDGITDLSGNVETWTSTLEDPAGSGAEDGAAGPPRLTWSPALERLDAPDGAARVVRGGSWMDNHSRLHPTYGVGFGPDFCPESVGLRVACG